jgi:hypothetical protein
MGLDMYLLLEDIETGEIIEYSYYRKFNALQGYFEQNYNISNPGKILLKENIISDLYLRLNEIRYSPEKANLLLPSYPGPFFGSYEYDRLYHSISIRQLWISITRSLSIIKSTAYIMPRTGENIIL